MTDQLQSAILSPTSDSRRSSPIRMTHEESTTLSSSRPQRQKVEARTGARRVRTANKMRRAERQRERMGVLPEREWIMRPPHPQRKLG